MSVGSLWDLSFKRLPGETVETSEPDRGTTSLPFTEPRSRHSQYLSRLRAEGPVVQFRRMNRWFSRSADKAHMCSCTKISFFIRNPLNSPQIFIPINK